MHILFPLFPGMTVSQIEERLPSPSSTRSYVVRISPRLFLEPLFVASYVRRGKLIALSVGRLDCEDVFCIDGTGKLHLSLTKDTYQTLGLQGQALKASMTASGRAGDRKSGTADRFLVTIDLRASYFTPGRPAYDRTSARFKAWDEARGDSEHHGSWDVLLSWSDDDRPLGAEVQYPPRFVTADSVREIFASRQIETVSDVWVPSSDDAWAHLRRGWTDGNNRGQLGWIDWLESLGVVTEWAGLATTKSECIRTFSRPDHLNAYEVPAPRTHGTLVKISYSGFLPVALGVHITNVMREVISKSASSMAVVQAAGFGDAPLCWSSFDARTKKGEQQDGHDTLTGAKVKEGGRSPDQSANDDDDERDTGLRARRKRSKKRQKRGFTRPDQLGFQVRNPHSIATASGWQSLLFAPQADLADYILIENVGDSQRS